MSTALVPVQDIERMALAVAKSGLFGVNTPDQAMALMLIAQAEGLHPAIAARDYFVIKGKPKLSSDAMLARFQAAGGSVKWTAYTDEKVSGVFSHPQGGSVEVDWTPERALRTESINRDMHRKFPRQMLRARCISEGVRTVFPGATGGMYVPEDAPNAEQPPQTPAAPKNMGNAEIIVETADVLKRIADARTIEQLEAIRPDIRRMRGDDKQQALTAAKERGEIIRSATKADDIDPETGEVIAQPAGEI